MLKTCLCACLWCLLFPTLESCSITLCTVGQPSLFEPFLYLLVSRWPSVGVCKWRMFAMSLPRQSIPAQSPSGRSVTTTGGVPIKALRAMAQATLPWVMRAEEIMPSGWWWLTSLQVFIFVLVTRTKCMTIHGIGSILLEVRGGQY